MIEQTNTIHLIKWLCYYYFC